MTSAPWAVDPAADLAVQRLRRDARHLLARGGRWTTPGLIDGLRTVWESQTPPGEWLAAALIGDPALWRLPDGTWVHRGAVWDERCATTRPTPAACRAGVVPVDIDLHAALLPYEGWVRIPAVHGRHRGVLELVTPTTGSLLLACPWPLAIPDDGLLAVHPEPEGVRLCPARLDPVVDARERRALARRLRAHPEALGPVGEAAVPPRALPRPWTVIDVVLARLADDPGAGREPTAPLSRMLQDLTAGGVSDRAPAARTG